MNISYKFVPYILFLAFGVYLMYLGFRIARAQGRRKIAFAVGLLGFSAFMWVVVALRIETGTGDASLTADSVKTLKTVRQQLGGFGAGLAVGLLLTGNLFRSNWAAREEGDSKGKQHQLKSAGNERSR